MWKVKIGTWINRFVLWGVILVGIMFLVLWTWFFSSGVTQNIDSVKKSNAPDYYAQEIEVWSYAPDGHLADRIIARNMVHIPTEGMHFTASKFWHYDEKSHLLDWVASSDNAQIGVDRKTVYLHRNVAVWQTAPQDHAAIQLHTKKMVMHVKYAL